jgi:FeS assembly SUF system protein
MDRDEKRQEAQQGTGQEPPQAAVRLPVLPHSGKADELRRQMQADRENAAAAVPPPAQATAGAQPQVSSSGEPAPVASPAGPAKSIQQKLLEGKIIEVIRQIYDPEIPVNIYDLGLIYEIDVREDNAVKVKMTLTAPACPVAGTLPPEVEKRIENIPEVKSADVELVWDPPWSRDRMSEAAQLTLGLF